MSIECPGLSREQTAEVEARARAALLTAGLDVAELELGCDAEQVRAKLRVRGETSESVVPLDAGAVPGQLMRALDGAIQRSTQPHEPQPEPAAPSSATFESDRAPSVSTQPTIAAPPPSAEPRRAPVPPRGPRLVASVAAGGVLEAWGSRLVPGALLHSRFGGEQVGVTWSASYQVAQASLFRVGELGVALGADYRPQRAGGLVLEASVGFSLLSVTPHAPYRPRGATSLSAGFVRALLARPIALGRFAIVPSAGVRLFTAPRRLRLDGQQQLKLGYAAPELLLGVSYRFD